MCIVFFLTHVCNLQVIPEELRIKWQAEVEALDAKLGGVPDKPISSLLLMLEAPEEMVVICTTGMVATAIVHHSHFILYHSFRAREDHL